MFRIRLSKMERWNLHQKRWDLLGLPSSCIQLKVQQLINVTHLLLQRQKCYPHRGTLLKHPEFSLRSDLVGIVIMHAVSSAGCTCSVLSVLYSAGSVCSVTLSSCHGVRQNVHGSTAVFSLSTHTYALSPSLYSHQASATRSEHRRVWQISV